MTLSSWFSFGGKRRNEVTAKEQAAAVMELIFKYAEVCRTHSGVIVDERLLPAPKDVLKAALRLCIRGETDANRKEFFKGGYLLLSNFQPLTEAEKLIIAEQGKLSQVGLDANSPPEMVKTRLAAEASIMPAFLALLTRTQEEMEVLQQDVARLEAINDAND